MYRHTHFRVQIWSLCNIAYRSAYDRKCISFYRRTALVYLLCFKFGTFALLTLSSNCILKCKMCHIWTWSVCIMVHSPSLSFVPNRICIFGYILYSFSFFSLFHFRLSIRCNIIKCVWILIHPTEMSTV